MGSDYDIYLTMMGTIVSVVFITCSMTYCKHQDEQHTIRQLIESGYFQENSQNSNPSGAESPVGK